MQGQYTPTQFSCESNCPIFYAATRRQNLAPDSVASRVLCKFRHLQSGTAIARSDRMFQPSASISQTAPTCAGESIAAPNQTFFVAPTRRSPALDGVRRRLLRERRRRKVGRSYDMALELARVIPRYSRVLDVGCGNGYIAHHLSALLGNQVIGIDLDRMTEAPIDYRQFDGMRFPVGDQSVEAVLLCYVLHHAQDLGIVMSELRRVLRDEGLAVIYEDIPECWWDRFVCWTHNLKWQGRTGRCTFRLDSEWRSLFGFAGFELITERQLSRWRNLIHPVSRRFFLLKRKSAREE
jgi:SAM-dependent methyltransferase